MFCRTLKNHEPLDTKKMQFSCNRRSAPLLNTKSGIQQSCHVPSLTRYPASVLPLQHLGGTSFAPKQSEPAIIILQAHSLNTYGDGLVVVVQRKGLRPCLFMNEEEEASTHKIT
jgi:hypothetical protein